MTNVILALAVLAAAMILLNLLLLYRLEDLRALVPQQVREAVAEHAPELYDGTQYVRRAVGNELAIIAERSENKIDDVIVEIIDESGNHLVLTGFRVLGYAPET